MLLFYDTCALLNQLQTAFDDFFYISNITLKELENIKTSAIKDNDVKYRARRVLHLLDENRGRYEIIPYSNTNPIPLQFQPLLFDNNDTKIILTAYDLQTERQDNVYFVTDDLACEFLAQQFGLQTKFLTAQEQELYTGYLYFQAESDEQLATFYQDSAIKDSLTKDFLLPNQYLLVKDKNNEIVDIFKKENEELINLTNNHYECYSKMFGKIKPKDAYQKCALDSLQKNKITMLRGTAGTGKSYVALGYLFSLLEKGHIDRIIIFCNTVATMGSAKLGFYPGSRTEKLMDSQIGNFLSSKFGDSMAVEKLIANGQLILLPVSDIRGYDTSGTNAGIYITEAQNMDIELMKLALQRIGEDSICILDGDDRTQVDMSIYAGNNNGMKRVSEVFRGEDIYGEVTLQNIYRSKIASIADKM